VKVSLGKLTVSIHEAGLPQPLHRLFSSLPASTEPAGIELKIAAAVPAGAGDHSETFLAAGAELGSSWLRFSDDAAPVGYRLSRKDDGTYEIVCSLRDYGNCRGFRNRLRQRRLFNNFFMGDAEQSLNILYCLWFYITQVAMVAADTTYLHASGVERGGRAVLLPAWGGVGKTSMLYRFMQEDGWRFLADDLAIVDSSGTVHKNPTPIAVYPYNLVGQDALQRHVLSRETATGLLHWHVWKMLKGPDRVGRRIFPDDLFGPGRMGTACGLAAVCYLVPWTGRDFRMKPQSAEELADRAVNVVLAEIRQFRRDYQAWNSVAQRALFPPVWKLAEASREILIRAFMGRELHVAFVPRGSHPSKLFDFLRTNLLEKYGF
jgi:hypothetical protein